MIWVISLKRYVSAVIVAAGKGLRMGGDIEKQFLIIKDKTIITYTLEVFESCEFIDEIILVLSEKNIDFFRAEFSNKFKKIKFAKGGEKRQDSVCNALNILDEKSNIVLVHDGVRPFVTHSLIKSIIDNCAAYDACIPAIKVKDTIKKCKDNFVIETLERDSLYNIQTPQGFKTGLLKLCYDKLINSDINFTDEASLLEALGYKIFITEGDYKNIKITTKDDLLFAEAILNSAAVLNS